MSHALALALHLAFGLTILLFGRRLFWVFVAVAGFVGAFEVAQLLFPGGESWVLLLIALGAGGVGAMLAIGFQYFAALLAGFMAGVYAAMPLLNMFPGAAWIPFLGGLLGAVVMILVFDWALILLSSMLGAQIIVSMLSFEGIGAGLLYVLLLAVGATVQLAFLEAAKGPR